MSKQRKCVNKTQVNAHRNSDYKSRSGRSRKPSNKKKTTNKDESINELDTTRSNNPTWYYFDEKLADLVSQLSFQNLAGFPISYDGVDLDVPNVVRICLNPSPGVQKSAYYGTALAQSTGINMAAFRIYSKLSAFTGRTQSYAPQDVATMILAMGEIISNVEFIRRGFGIAYTMNMRNRSYPKQVLEVGMCIDADDLFANLANYRTKFNALLTLINQLPIPKSVAYFDKCAALYEKVYLDSPSSMAQTLIPVPFTSWILDETSYPGGTILQTIPVTCDSSFNYLTNPVTMAVHLSRLESMISALLNSSTLQVVYTDILNYASKVNTEFWKFDFLYQDYLIVPEYDLNFLLQMHNATIAGMPNLATLTTGTLNATPYNDVYPDPNNNSIFYNPKFPTIASVVNGFARTGNVAIIDMLSDQVSLTDRVEVTRYTSISKGTMFTGNAGYIDTALPDHYVALVYFQTMTSNLSVNVATSTVQIASNFPDVSSLVANIDWAPRFFEANAGATALTGRYTGDVNFYTTVDEQYLRKLHDFVSLALYDLR